MAEEHLVLRRSAASTFVVFLAVVGCALVPCGCLSSDSLFNATFLQQLYGGGSGNADLPGDAPAIVAEVVNETNRNVEYRFTWRDGDGQIQERSGALSPGDSYAEMLICTIQEITLGDVSDLTATGAIVRLGDGSTADPYIEVEAFGILLQEGINYDCGDSISFRILNSSATLSGYRVYAYVNRSGLQTTEDDSTGDTTDG